MIKSTLAGVLAALTIALGSGPRTGDTVDDQTEDNRNSQSVVTPTGDGPITVF